MKVREKEEEDAEEEVVGQAEIIVELGFDGQILKDAHGSRCGTLQVAWRHKPCSDHLLVLASSCLSYLQEHLPDTCFQSEPVFTIWFACLFCVPPIKGATRRWLACVCRLGGHRQARCWRRGWA